MTNETQIQEREERIDPSYGHPIGSRRLEIEKLHHKLYQKYFTLCDEINKKYKGAFEAININHKLSVSDYIRQLNNHGYFDLLSLSQGERRQLDGSALGRIVSNEPSKIFDISNHENMLDASDSIFRNDDDPVLSTVLNDDVHKLNVPGNIKRERKKARHRSDVYSRRLQKHVYERYLSEAVGKPITVEEYEREFGFLSEGGQK